MVVINMQMDPITAKRLAAKEGEDAEVARLSLVLSPSTATVLETGSWAIFATATAGKEHILDLTILPRQWVPITAVEVHPERRQIAKRAFEASQPMASVKRGKVDDSSAKSGDAVAFQTVPRGVGVIAIHDAAEASRTVTRRPGHPLEHLEPGATAKIIGHQGDYTLTCCETIMLQTNSLVLKAKHSEIPSVAVVKVLRTPPYSAESVMPDRAAAKIASTAEMWLREFKNHSKLSQHTAVVRLYDADASAGGICDIGIEDAKQILADMTAAVAYVHGKGIVHNDIKPANILFKPARGAVLIDFGLSSELRETIAHAGGSPWYIPPEYIINGKRGTPGDVFALGVVMLFVLRKIPLLESSELKWMIADVRKREGQNAARNTMHQWLGIVDRASRSSDGLQHAPLGALVREMLVIASRRIEET
ncbi:Calcium/calmodulin-dependent protein kinase type II like [Verticillium longisporum]|nr:Calcium/calmodulin-dependent protein kinase type II like [Verticillium longisporum]